jgi:hypothetical protein
VCLRVCVCVCARVPTRPQAYKYVLLFGNQLRNHFNHWYQTRKTSVRISCYLGRHHLMFPTEIWLPPLHARHWPACRLPDRALPPPRPASPTETRDGNGYKPAGFSLLRPRPIPTKQNSSRQVTHLVSRIEVSSQTQTRRVKKTHRVTHLNFFTACYNKKSILSKINYEI